MPRPLALTLGEPAGIGPGPCHCAMAAARNDLDLPRRSTLIADLEFLGTARPASRHADRASRRARRGTPGAMFSAALPVVDISVAGDRRPRSSRCVERGPARPSAAIRLGVRHVLDGEGPAPSLPIRSPRTCFTGPAFPSRGHTEYLARLAAGGDRHTAAAGHDACGRRKLAVVAGGRSILPLAAGPGARSTPS